MTRPDVTNQAVVAHFFAPLDGPLAAAAHDLVRATWTDCQQAFAATAPIPSTGLPSRIPQTLPRPAVTGSALVAAAQRPDGTAQLILRVEHDVLALSVMVTGATGRWEHTDPALFTPADDQPLLGSVLFLLGNNEEPFARPALPTWADSSDWRDTALAGSLALWELGSRDDDRSHRRFVALSAPRNDWTLGSWTWSHDGRPEMPRLARYLMHVAKIRYELRVWSAFRDVAELCGSHYGDVAELTRAVTAAKAMRHTVDIATTNARSALAHDHTDIGAADPLADDRELAAWFRQRLDDAIVYLDTFLDGALSPGTAPSAAVETPRDRRVRVLAVADEWFPRQGGLSVFNRRLCIAVAQAGAEVLCLLPTASGEERDDAAEAGVVLVTTPDLPGSTVRERLMRKPVLPGGTPPDIVIGHGRITGPMAKCQAEDHFPGSARLHLLHMAPDQLEWFKQDRATDAGSRAEERTRAELDLARHAARVLPVGPKLARWAMRDLSALNGTAPPVHRIDPGFDRGTDPSRRPLGGDPQILVMGRVDDARIKGLDLAAKALGRARELSPAQEKWELLVRGAPHGESEPVQVAVCDWAGHHKIQVIVRPFTTNSEHIGEDLRRASLVLMPSRAEGFGLVGAEAITAGTPLLVSADSGLGMLLHEVLPRELADRVVVPVEGRDEVDVARWSSMINGIMVNREAAFETARAVQAEMAAHRTWATAAAAVLGVLVARPGTSAG